jgi:hypothetical protein
MAASQQDAAEQQQQPRAGDRWDDSHRPDRLPSRAADGQQNAMGKKQGGFPAITIDANVFSGYLLAI